MVKFFAGGFIGGIFIQSLASPTQELFLLSLVLGIVSFLIFLFFSKKYLFIGFIIFGLALGFLRFSFVIPVSESQIFDIFAQNKEKISVLGTISSDPVMGNAYTEFVLDIEHIIVPDDTPFPVSTTALVRTDTFHTLEYGQHIRVVSTPQKPEPFVTETERIFSYDTYLAKDGIYYIFPYAEVIHTGEGKSSVLRTLYRFKNFFLNHIYSSTREPEAGFLAGILFGQENALDQDLDDMFRTVGLSHIVVLSGYNMSVVIVLLMSLLAFLPRGIRSIIALLGITLFALLVGAGPTVIRASLMASLLVVASLFGREYRIERALVITGIAMVALNPYILLFDISFQLSFLATYGLIVLVPWVEHKLAFLPSFFLIRESATATIAAQIMVTPLLLYRIGDISLISPLVNILVLPLIPLIMGIGFFTALISIVSPWLLAPFVFLSTSILHYPLWIADVFSSLSFASLRFPPFHWSVMVALYSVIFIWIYFSLNQHHKT